MPALPRSRAGAAAVLAPVRPGRRRRHGAPPFLPPRDGDGDGDGDGNDGEGFSPRGGPGGLGPFALGLALVGITTLFLVLIAVWLLLRRPAPDWRAAQAPHALWISTACLAASSFAIELAARRARRGRARQPAARRWLGGGLLLGLAFLVAQAQLWVTLWRAGFVPASGGYAAVFFALTGLHALHVLAGLAFLGFLVRRLGHDVHASGVRLGAVYWHYMGVIWGVLFALLYWVR